VPRSSTYLEVEQEVVRILAQLGDPEVAMVDVPFHGAIASNGATIVAPSLDRGTIHANRFDGRPIKVVEDAAAVAYDGAVTVSGAHSATATVVAVNDATDIRAGHIIEVNASEKMLVRAVSGNNLTVTRGYQATTAAALAGGETVRYDPFGFVTAVDDAGFASGGVLTVSPNFASVTGTEIAAQYAAGSFLMYPKGLWPDYVRSRINAVLRNTEHPHFWIPSLVTDSDMESADLANWDAVNTPGTREFVTTAAHVLFGERALHLDGADDGEGAETEDFAVSENETLNVVVFLKVVSGSVEVVLRNVSAGTDRRAVTGLNEELYSTVWFTETLDADCELAALRFLGESTDSEFYVSAHAVVQSQHRRLYSVPPWWTRAERQMAEAVQLLPGYAAEANDSYISLSERQYADMGIRFLRSDRDANPLRVEFACHSSYPLAFKVMRPFAELGGDASTTYADRDYVAWRTVANILRDRGDQAWAFWARKAGEQAALQGYGRRELRSEEARTFV
jgi:hypothetical protein